MSEAVDPYAYEPECSRRTILSAVQSPAREHVILAALLNSYQELAHWPPDLDASTGPRVQDVVQELEQGPESVEEKDARIVGMMAVATEFEIARNNLTADKWGIAPHLGMLNAIGSAMAAGLIVSPESLRMATTFHQAHSQYESVRETDDPYAPSSTEPAAEQLRRLMRFYGTLHLDDSVEDFMSYYTYELDNRVYHAVPGPEFVEACSDYPEYQPMLRMYNHILAEILRTRQSLIDREDELRLYWEQKRAELIDGLGGEREEQGSEALIEIDVRDTETVQLPDGQEIL